MARVQLRCDCGDVSHGATIALDEDILAPGGEAWPEDVHIGSVLTIWRRVRTGYDDNGAPVFSWEALAPANAVDYQQRKEVDPVAGITLVVADATITYDGPDIPHETMAIRDQDGRLWRVRSASVGAGVMRVTMVRLDQEPDGAPG